MYKSSKIYIAGHTGLVGSAIFKDLKEKGYENIIYRTHSELDLTDCRAVEEFFQEEKPEYVFLAAAKVGGITANNTYRAEFIYENLMIQTHVIHQSYLHGVKKLMFLGSTCIYPKNCPQPIKEEYLLTGSLEYTNEPYAIAKIAGIKMCESYNLQYGTNFISVMPTNLFGPGDNFDLERSHVLPALLRKMHLGRILEEKDWVALRKSVEKIPLTGVTERSKLPEILTTLQKHGVEQTEDGVRIEIWGSGKPEREFLWSEDMANACTYIMEKIDFSELAKYSEGNSIRNTHLNIGTGNDISIKDLAYLIKEITGFKGELFFNKTKADGTPKKLTDSSRLKNLGWRPQVGLKEGIQRMHDDLLDHSFSSYGKPEQVS